MGMAWDGDGDVGNLVWPPKRTGLGESVSPSRGTREIGKNDLSVGKWENFGCRNAVGQFDKWRHSLILSFLSRRTKDNRRPNLPSEETIEFH